MNLNREFPEKHLLIKKSIFTSENCLTTRSAFMDCRKIEFLEATDEHVPTCNYFAYEYLFCDKFKDFAKTDPLLHGVNDDFEKANIITNWVHNQWKHSGWNEPSVPEPIQILKEAKAGKKFRCVEYSIVLQAALNCNNLKSLVLYLRTQDVETRKSGAGHVVVECYLESVRRWVMFDPQTNVHSEKNDIPLNAVELQRELSLFPEEVRMIAFNTPLDSRLKKKY